FRAKHRKQYKIKCRCKSPKTAYSEKGQLFIKVVNWCFSSYPFEKIIIGPMPIKHIKKAEQNVESEMLLPK
ncbi:hypothetical protein, partial [Fusicatenibacter saccharivorans]|uniref:hypothetical protein n=1 Tax=Fusicatenibacter saccharivorans TaxID=1150298 RepID=UPI003F929AE3